MAKIIKTGVQENALKMINSNLRTLTGVNGILNASGEICLLNITVGSQRVSITVEKPFGDEILQEIRKKLTKETKTLAKKNAIVLDGNDLTVLENRHQEMESLGLESQGQEKKDEDRDK